MIRCFLASIPKHDEIKSILIPSICSISLVIGGSTYCKMYHSMSITILPLEARSSSGCLALAARPALASSFSVTQIKNGIKLPTKSASLLPYIFNLLAIATCGNALKSEYSLGALVNCFVMMY